MEENTNKEAINKAILEAKKEVFDELSFCMARQVVPKKESFYRLPTKLYIKLREKHLGECTVQTANKK